MNTEEINRHARLQKELLDLKVKCESQRLQLAMAKVACAFGEKAIKQREALLTAAESAKRWISGYAELQGVHEGLALVIAQVKEENANA